MTSSLLIRSGDEITPGYMTEVMRSCGRISDDQSVTNAEAVSFGDQAGLLGALYRVNVSYSDGASGPATVIVKFPVEDEIQRATCDALGFFNRECTFYSEMAASAPFRTAEIYGQAQADDSTDFVILMEDLGGLAQIDQIVGATPEEMDKVIVALAKLHATWWESDKLKPLQDPFLPLDNPIYHAALPSVFAGGWDRAKEHASDRLTPAVIEFGDHYAEHLPNLLAAINTPMTLLHGDARADNMLLDDAGNLAMIDFQIVSTGAGIFDVGYFLAQSVTQDIRNAHQDRVLELYQSNLADGGVTMSMDELNRGYRQALAFCLIYGVTSFAGWDSFDGRQHELMREMLGRSVQSIEDTGTLDALPGIG